MFDKWAPKIFSQNSALVSDWFAADIIQGTKNLPCSLDFMRTDIFLFPNVKEALAGHTLTNNSLTTAWVGRHHQQRGECRRVPEVHGMIVVFSTAS